MALTKETRFIIAIAIQLAVIFGMIAYKASTLRAGAVVNLRIEPVDPRDMLRGDYITFRYGISSLGRAMLRDGPVRNGETVYVTLRKSGKLWIADAVLKTKPEGEDAPFIRGRVAGGGLESGAPLSAWREAGGPPIRVVYGIEQYFIPEGKGAGLNLRGATNQTFARVVVDRNGKAVLKQIYIDGTPWP